MQLLTTHQHKAPLHCKASASPTSTPQPRAEAAPTSCPQLYNPHMASPSIEPNSGTCACPALPLQFKGPSCALIAQ